jgi:hypothetical protein
MSRLPWAAAFALVVSPLMVAPPVGAQVPCDALVQAAVEAAQRDDFGEAGRLLLDARLRCPDDPNVLRDLAGLRFRQGDYAEAARLGHALLELEPGSTSAWDLIAATRYLRDDPLGALDAWNRIGRPTTRSVRIRDAAGAGGGAVISWAEGVAGIVPGDELTRAAILLGARRLGQIPSIERARLEYRPEPRAGASVEGYVTFRPRHTFTRSALPGHLLRAVGGRVELGGRPGGDGTPGGTRGGVGTSAWSAQGVADGSLREGRAALAHRAPGIQGVWNWELHHATGRFEPAGAAPLRARRTGARWSHRAWVHPIVQVEGTLGADTWRGRGSYGVVGAALDLVPGRLPARLRWEVDGWLGDDRFGRVAFRAGTELAPLSSTELTLRGGMDVISRSASPDVMPRFGADRASTHLMRADRVVGSDGVLRPAFPGSSWAHGGAEFIRWWAPGGVLRVGGAGFVDAVRVLDPPPGAPRGAAHPGVGLRLGIPGLSGYLRADVAIDAAGGDPVLSAAWMGR